MRVMMLLSSLWMPSIEFTVCALPISVVITAPSVDTTDL